MLRRSSRGGFVNQLMRDFNRTSRYLNEDYVFGDNQEMDDYPQQQEAPRAPRYRSEQGDDRYSEDDEKAMHAQEVVRDEPIIQKIRETAIEGLRKYSEDPTSSIYEFFKKVFLESDKVLTEGPSK